MNRPEASPPPHPHERRRALLQALARLAGYASVVIVVATAVFILLPKPEGKKTSAAKSSEPAPYRSPMDTIFESDSALAHARIEAAVKAYFEARTWKELQAVCRDPVRVGPLMKAYYQNRPLVPLPWRELAWARPLRESGHVLFYVRSEFDGHEAVNLVVEQKGGEFRVDWESHVRHSEMDWRDFVKIRPAEPRLFRVLGSLQAEGEPGEPRFLEIRHPDFETPVIQAKFSPKDPFSEGLRAQLELGAWKNVPLTLRLCYEEKDRSKESGAVRITGVEGKGWLILSRKQEPST